MMPETTREHVIEVACTLDRATFEAESCAAGPGRYEGAWDLSLLVAVDIMAMHGAADEQGGSTETGRHGARVHRWVVWTDGEGFRTLEEFATVEAAREAIADAEHEMFGDVVDE